jgi:hypothetical protein
MFNIFAEINPEDMLNIVNFIYKGEIKLAGDAYQRFLQLANRFQLKIEDDQQKRREKLKVPRQTYINDLPPEVLTKILSFLPTFDVLRNVGRVSKRFYELSKHPQSHINVCLNLMFADNTTSEFLKQATQMRTLSIGFSIAGHVNRTFQDWKNNAYDPDDMLLVLRDHQQLRSLDVYEFQVSQGEE